MASNSQGIRLAIQGILAIVIVGLAYFLFVSITAPYEAVERDEALTEQVRERMNKIRSAMIYYERQNRRYPSTLDSLVYFIKTDSLLSIPGKADSVFEEPGFVADSLLRSPRNGQPFKLAVNDTARVKTYLLEAPDCPRFEPDCDPDFIGTLLPDVTLLNAASWE
jgi:hypothetical protein